MDNRQKAELDQRFAARRAALVEEIARKLAASRDKTGSESIDQIIAVGDSASADTMASIDLAEARRDIQEVRDVDAARARLADGTYGTCVDCDEAIADARLVAYPTAKRCTACQTAHEKRRRPGDGTRL